MSGDIAIEAKKRDITGSAKLRKVRSAGRIPAVVYSKGNPGEPLTLDEHGFAQMLRHHTSESIIMKLRIDGEGERNVLLQDVQHHPVSGRILHVDFHEISMTERLTVSVPLELKGIPVGVSKQGGMLEHLLREIEVECLPSDVVEEFVIDVSGLSIGEGLTVNDIPLDPGKYAVVTSGEIAVAAVSAPRTAEAEEGAEGEEATGVRVSEPERVGAADEAE
jgi:large subunit ribosomal protein L25